MLTTLGQIGAIDHYDADGFAHFNPCWASTDTPDFVTALTTAVHAQRQDISPSRLAGWFGRFENDDIQNDSEPVELYVAVLPEGAGDCIKINDDVQLLKLK